MYLESSYNFEHLRFHSTGKIITNFLSHCNYEFNSWLHGESAIDDRARLLSPWKNARIRSWAAIVEQVFQFRAPSGVWDGSMKWIPLEPLTVKGTETSIGVQLELSPSYCFAVHCPLPRGWRSWGTREGEPFFGESNCRPVQMGESLFLEIIAYNLTHEADP